MWNKKLRDAEQQAVNNAFEAAKWKAIADAYRGKQRDNKVNGQSTARTQFYREDLWQILYGCFDVEIENGQNRGYILDCLLRNGIICAMHSPDGNRLWRCGLGGRALDDQPEYATVTSEFLLKAYQPIIGKECELIYLSHWPRLYNYCQLVDIYAEKLASIDSDIDINIINSKLAFAFLTNSKKQAMLWKSIYKQVTNGEPAVFPKATNLRDSDLGEPTVLFNNLRNNFIAGDAIDVKRKIYNEFYTRIGVNNLVTEKKERMISGEINVNNIELLANTENIQVNLDECCERVNKMFSDIGIHIKFKWREPLERGLENDISNAGGLQQDLQDKAAGRSS